MSRWVLVVLVLAGCGPWSPGWRSPSSTSEADAALAHARAEAEAGRPKNALALYEDLARDRAGEDVAAMALHEIAILRLDPRSPVRDRRSAQQALTRLARQYPKTRWGREASAWRVLFRQVDRCEAEATRLGADADRLRQTIESLKDMDDDFEDLP